MANITYSAPVRGIDKSLYFNHMMKTGGRSAFEALRCWKADANQRGGVSFRLTTKHAVCDFTDWNYSCTIIREPLERLLSHYRMILGNLRRFIENAKDYTPKEPPIRGPKNEDSMTWVQHGFNQFLEIYPKEYREHQLYFYSPSGKSGEAFDNIIKNTQIILFDRRQEGLDRFVEKINRDLAHINRSVGQIQDQAPPDWQTTKNVDFKPSEEQVVKAKKYLAEEYRFYEMVLDYYNKEEL